MKTDRGLIEAGRAVISLVRETEITFLAAAIAYYALVSTLPARRSSGSRSSSGARSGSSGA